MLSVLGYLQPKRTFLPCSGVGRHINEVFSRLSINENVRLRLLFAKQYLGEDQLLPLNAPLRDIPFSTFGIPERLFERSAKLFHWPKIDKWASSFEWVFSPSDVYLPQRSCKVAITIHDVQALETDLPWSNTKSHRIFRAKWLTWLKPAIESSRIVFTVSNFSRDRLIELTGAPPEKIVVSGNGVSSVWNSSNEICSSVQVRTRHRIGDKTNLRSGRPFLLIVGGLRLKKGARWVVNVARLCKKANLDIDFVVAGPNEEEFEIEARTLGNFQLLNWVSDSELQELNRNATAVLFLSPYEGFGLPVVESQACGTPVIVSNCASLPEVTGAGGLVVYPGNSDEVLHAIRSILFDETCRVKLIEAGKRNVENYSWDSVVNRIQDAMEARS